MVVSLKTIFLNVVFENSLIIYNRAGGFGGGMGASTASDFTRYRSKTCPFKRPCITSCTPRFSDLPPALYSV